MIKEIKSLYIEVSKACNLSCKYCYNTVTDIDIENENNKPKYLKYFLDKFESIIDEQVQVCFHGGEALLKLDLLKIMSSLILEVKPEAIFVIQTNGHILKDKEVRDYIDSLNNKSIVVSFDSDEKHPSKLPKESLDFIKVQGNQCASFVVDGKEDIKNIDLIKDIRPYFPFPVQVIYNFFKSDELKETYIELSDKLKSIDYTPNDESLNLSVDKCGEVVITFDNKFKFCTSKLHGITDEDFKKSSELLESYDCENCEFKKYCVRCPVRMANFRNNLCYFTKAISGKL